MVSIGWRRAEVWIYIGLFCDKHLAHVNKVYGSIRSETLDKEKIETDTRCSLADCRDLVSFAVERKDWKDA